MACILLRQSFGMFVSGTVRLYSITVSNDLQRSSFYVNLETNNEAYLKYSIDKNRNIINFEHTFVPIDGKGRGIGKLLAEAAFQFAIDNKMKIKTECSFAAKYYKDNETKYKEFMLQ